MRHNINLLKHYKNVIFLFFILVIIGLSSCEEKCIGIINNSYEGFGYFIYKNESQDGLYQIYFIPVCNNLEKEKYDNKELRPMLGMIFYSSSKNHQFRDIFIYSKPYSKIYYDPLNRDTSRISYQYLPVYIEFEGLNFTETFSLSPKIQREKIHFINDDTYNIDFKWIHRNINEVINIKRLEPLGIKRPEKLIISQEEKDSIIYVYENQDFSGLENISIGILEEGKSMIIYFISKRNEENYILKYNLKESVISKFSYFDIPEGEKILSEEELTSIIENFRKYGIYMLEIDEEKNIYINPYEINAPPYYMKCKSDTTKQLLEKNDFIYEKYKDNWYINKNYNEFLGR